MSSRKEGYHDILARLPIDLWEKLRAEAEAQERSVNGQLVFILRERYQPPAPAPETRTRRRKS